ncbi:unnamed protein product [Ambrosiozyma monospora]|uniref:Unnamed protein product n=1 Tax=Ambrosiozyma monospora TaxID=43982 RepID=A0ACB5T643_AMBMO|nr:unnamed protein product [Ambrosiozyma monospora]
MKFSTALAIIAATAIAAPIPQDASTSFTEQSVAKAAAKPVTAKPATGGSVASKPSTGDTSVWDKLDKIATPVTILSDGTNIYNTLSGEAVPQKRDLDVDPVAKAAAKPVTAKPVTGGPVASKPSTGDTSVWDKLDKIATPVTILSDGTNIYNTLSGGNKQDTAAAPDAAAPDPSASTATEAAPVAAQAPQTPQ